MMDQLTTKVAWYQQQKSGEAKTEQDWKVFQSHRLHNEWQNKSLMSTIWLSNNCLSTFWYIIVWCFGIYCMKCLLYKQINSQMTWTSKSNLKIANNFWNSRQRPPITLEFELCTLLAEECGEIPGIWKEQQPRHPHLVGWPFDQSKYKAKTMPKANS